MEFVRLGPSARFVTLSVGLVALTSTAILAFAVLEDPVRSISRDAGSVSLGAGVSDNDGARTTQASDPAITCDV
ncbi:MAG: hypothetical protein ACRD1T_06110, partial [Acidimicrobiia bacterium]